MDPSTSGNTFVKRKKSVTCFVPQCPSNSIKYPNKLFLTVPIKPDLREMWMKAARRQDLRSPVSKLRCCEDHFEMENDVENWIKFKLTGGKLILKKGVIPHIFDCQQIMQRSKPTSDELKRKRQEILQSIENEQTRDLESSFGQLKRKRQEVLQSIENEQATESESSFDQVTNEQDISKDLKKYRHQSIQVAVYPHKRSKEVQVAMKTSTTNTAVSPKKVKMKNKRLSPIKISTYNLIYSDSDNESKKSILEIEGETGSTSGSVLSDLLSDAETERKKLALQLTIRNITRDSKLYIGVPNDSIVILNLIEEAIQEPYNHICLVLKKLKHNQPFKILADDFGIHETTASRIFSSVSCKMAKVLKSFIIKPPLQTVKDNLPIAFRDSYSNTYCIIDCMEIEIEIPANALHQSLTYSSYKKCNTMKYLISATPDGVINFVSEGFGGRTSDIRLCQESHFFDCLPPGVSIMADRGFKHIEGELTKRNFTLIRPPSVSSSEKSSKKQVKQAKKIASLRIHIERVIRRLREYSFLKSHSCIDHNLIPYLDSAIIICSALVNLQPTLVN